jgi:protein-L-isoaspartate(D-aspartate) O-methyltransferase
MLADIEAHYQDTYRFTGMSVLSEDVRMAMESVDRSLFVPQDQAMQAHQDSALSIGHGQTISQPFIVALMTQLLSPQSYHSVLEIGTGSGYQAAVLSRLVAQVYSVEIIGTLAIQAAENLSRNGFNNVHIDVGDGYDGWVEKEPFDSILITAAIPEIPDPLFNQLREGGRMVLPLGSSSGIQQLVVVEKTIDGTQDVRQVLPVNFVPFTRAH